MDAARSGQPLAHFSEGEQVVGIQEIEVISRAPALPPVTSSRAGGAVVRSWGQDMGGREALNPPRAPYVTLLFIGRYGHGCSPPTHPAVGDRVLAASVREPGGATDAHLIEMPPGAAIEEVTGQFEAVWGAATITPVTTRQRLVALAYAWWPLVVAVGLLALLGWVLARRIGQRRQG